jgi:flavin reductase (DIM6/NTAB) family NADH-FMN oxidoreductase RutF
MSNAPHREIEPAILYLGTPVVLVTTENEDGSTNISPMSSAWWLGWTCMLGFDASSKTPQNLLRTGQCVLNLPSAELVGSVDRLACLSGSDPLPRHKTMLGYRSEPDKFAAAGLTAVPSAEVRPGRIAECPIQLEAVVESHRRIGANDPRLLVPSVAVEVRIVRVHAAEGVLSPDYENRIDAARWRPLIMTLRQFFATGDAIHGSRLAAPPEEAYAGRAPRRRPAAAEA